MDIGRYVVLGLVCLLAYAAGELLARRHVPRLPVYLAVGALAGLVIGRLRDTADLAFPTMSAVALGVIGFVAGSHLVWRTIKPQVRPIGLQVAGMCVAVPLLVTPLVFVLLRDYDTDVRLAAAVLAGAVMLALSPPEAIAIISETRAAGPFTRYVLGATVVMDVMVVAAFSAALTLANSLLGEGGGSAGDVVLSVVVGLALAVTAGAVAGVLLALVMRLVTRTLLASALVVVAAGVTVWLATEAVHLAEDRWSIEVDVEALLVAMVAGVLIANASSRSVRFAEIVEGLAPYVYVVFFTLTGLALHLDALLAALVPAAILFVVRAAGLFAGSRVATALAAQPPEVRRVAWRAFMPQAGIALALAATVAAEFPEFGEMFATVVIGTVVLNEATGPFFLKSALVATGEVPVEEEQLA